MRAKLGFLILLSALLLATGARAVDNIGTRGTIAGLDLNTESAEIFLQYNGRLFVDTGSGVDEYRWGGTSCGSRLITDAQFAALQAAQNNKKMTIEPLSQDGQGLSKCLVGFTLVEKKKLKLFP